MKQPSKVHFMGIAGSGMSAVAQIAHHLGYKVSGCDLKVDSNYIEPLKKLGINIHSGHSEDHLEGIDILAVTPAVFYKSDSHPEVVKAKERGILMKWQEFMGRYLHEGKTLICIAGTHGKSTTTTMAGLLLENSGFDPTVEVGATVKEWQNNIRLGQGNYFVSEADEFHDNFISYHPNIIILNNIELDHPEYFSTLENLQKTHLSFINNLQSEGTLIYNADSQGILDILPQITRQDIKLVPYSLKEFPNYNYKISVAGDHNKSNALGIIKLAEVLKIPAETIARTLASFQGTARRMELVGEKNNIKVYDDYGNHPTAFAATIAGVKEQNPNSKIWAVIEPHTFSRLKTLLSELPPSLKQADEIIFAKTFASREKDPGDFSSQNLVDYINAHLPGNKARLINEFTDIAATLGTEAKPTDVILVMSSISGHQLCELILQAL